MFDSITQNGRRNCSKVIPPDQFNKIESLRRWPKPSTLINFQKKKKPGSYARFVLAIIIAGLFAT